MKFKLYGNLNTVNIMIKLFFIRLVVCIVLMLIGMSIGALAVVLLYSLFPALAYAWGVVYGLISSVLWYGAWFCLFNHNYFTSVCKFLRIDKFITKRYA